MQIHSPVSERPALLGGAPLIPSLPPTPWPIPDPEIARQIGDLYLSSQWSWNGPWEQRASAALASVHTARHAMLMVNGTVTLEAALHAVGVGPGDEVIVPSLTWLATAMAVLYTGATPVFVDVEPDTLCLCPEQTAAAVTSRTKAIIPVHLYGSMADLDRLVAIAQRHHLALIEDCAHAQGGRWDGRGLGSIGQIGSFSFQQSKTVSAGEGGAVITNDDDLAQRLYRFKHIGYSADALQGAAADGPPAGLACRNYRATEFQAIALVPQFEALADLTRRRNEAADRLTTALEALPGLKVQKRGRKADPGCQSYYNFILQYDPAQWSGLPKGRLIEALAAEGLPIGGTYGSVHRHLLWNMPESSYRIHGDWRDTQGAGCPVSVEIGTERSLGFMHKYLDLPQETLSRFVEGFAKVQRHASELL